MAPDIDILSAPENFSERKLCPNGVCTGVIGPEGICSQCGRREAGDGGPDRPSNESKIRKTARSSPAAERDVEQHAEQERAGRKSGGFDSDRLLCSDGACIGVVGADGCCKECGKPHPGA